MMKMDQSNAYWDYMRRSCGEKDPEASAGVLNAKCGAAAAAGRRRNERETADKWAGCEERVGAAADGFSSSYDHRQLSFGILGWTGSRSMEKEHQQLLTLSSCRAYG
ncbi:unnamed protein product [Caenorhabditis auriculariae]|uniref:Uncharacterized protein n=1 Tax=Caenorhabditis auriculariae TaxID=2777116 RepID=A0A8S1H5Z3_9PELO|nr:unnamed protein product [Caenorhabditis auriculariae]